MLKAHLPVRTVVGLPTLAAPQPFFNSLTTCLAMRPRRCLPVAALAHHAQHLARLPCMLACCPASGLPISAPPRVQVLLATLPRVASHLHIVWPLARKPLATSAYLVHCTTCSQAVCALLTRILRHVRLLLPAQCAPIMRASPTSAPSNCLEASRILRTLQAILRHHVLILHSMCQPVPAMSTSYLTSSRPCRHLRTISHQVTSPCRNLPACLPS